MSEKSDTDLADRVPRVVNDQPMLGHTGKLGVPRSVGYAPNDLRISCKRQTSRPHNHYVPLSTPALAAPRELTQARLSAACAG
jgi:hypothetical protein